jgi:hypothetical protein
MVGSEVSVVTRRGARVGRIGGWSGRLDEEGYEAMGEGEGPREADIVGGTTDWSVGRELPV